MKFPRSLRSRLLITIISCWVFPIFIVAFLSGYLLNLSYQQSSRNELTSGIENALEKLEIRIDSLFEESKAVSYDGVVRNSYRRYLQDGDSAELYRIVTDYLNQNFARDPKIHAAFVSFWNDPDIRPYTARGGIGVLRRYREQTEADILQKMQDIDTGIILLEYEGELYAARNLLDSHFDAYATIVLLCDIDELFQSVHDIGRISSAALTIDSSLLLSADNGLRTLSAGESLPAGDISFEMLCQGHSFIANIDLAAYNLLTDVPQIYGAIALVVLLVLPLLAVMILLFRRYITRPVEILVSANRHLQGGERGYIISENADSEEFQKLYEHFNTMSVELKNQFERSYMEQQTLQQARIKALQSQINPHFLNNTLEIINWEARLAGDDRVSAMIEALSTMLDAALDRDGRSRIKLSEELSYVDAYLYIIHERLGDSLCVVREISPALDDEQVPRLVLQPIVENAVEHDITPNRGGTITVRAYPVSDSVVLEVEHTGRLTSDDREAITSMLSSSVADTQISGHVGLRNVKQRLELLYGSSGMLTIFQADEAHVIARVTLGREHNIRQTNNSRQ